LSDIEEMIADLKVRINRLEAAFDEMAKGVTVYKNDKAYDEKERVR